MYLRNIARSQCRGLHVIRNDMNLNTLASQGADRRQKTPRIVAKHEHLRRSYVKVQRGGVRKFLGHYCVHQLRFLKYSARTIGQLADLPIYQGYRQIAAKA